MATTRRKVEDEGMKKGDQMCLIGFVHAVVASL
jgi:hypothetical protein